MVNSLTTIVNVKFRQFIYGGLLVCLFGFQPKKSEIIINGKITGDIPSELHYSVPIYGGTFEAFNAVVKPDSSGSFQIRIHSEKSAIVKLMIYGKASTKLIVEPYQKYSIAITLSKDGNSFDVLDSTKKGQNLFNALSYPAFIEAEAKKFKNDSTVALLKKNISILKTKDIAPFKELLVKKEISQSFFELVQADRDCYYSTLTANVLLSRLSKLFPDHLDKYPSDLNQFWGSLFVESPLTDQRVLSSSFWFDYAENYLHYKEYTDKDFSVQKLGGFYEAGLIHTHNIEEAKKHLSGVMLEYYEAEYIYINALQEKNEKELITLFEQFKIDYPKSEFIGYLKPMINPIVAYHKIVDEPLRKEIRFIDNENINTLSECVIPFKGKKVYVDVWATWCGPCKDEFKHGDKLRELIKSKGMEILYISIDKEQKDKQWKADVKFYNLEGVHIRANEKLNADLYRIFNQNGSMSIPWYILIDEKGNIFKDHASRPSEIDKLEKEFLEN